MLFEKTAQTIIADPNWEYNNFGAKKHGAARGHYKCSPVETISRIPVQNFSRPNSNLLLWGTLPKLDQAIDVMRAWGYSLITAVPWVKTVPSSAELAKGIGFWFQASAEILFICKNGKKTNSPKYKKYEKPDGLLVGGERNMNSVFYSRRGPHSRKPLSLIEWIESYLPGPYLELYATSNRPGWDCLGLNTGWLLTEKGAEWVGIENPTEATTGPQKKQPESHSSIWIVDRSQKEWLQKLSVPKT